MQLKLQVTDNLKNKLNSFSFRLNYHHRYTSSYGLIEDCIFCRTDKVTQIEREGWLW